MADLRSLVLTLAAVQAVACAPQPPKTEAEAQQEVAAAAEPEKAPVDDAAMKALAAADTAAGITPDDHMFHTNPKTIETVRLPHSTPGVWSARGYAEGDFFQPLDAKDETLPNGIKVHTVRFEMLASGNGRVVFEKRASDKPDDPVLEVRTVKFMIH